MERAKVIRGLRIAWSVVCGILCVLQIALWVRSYWWLDEANCPLRSPNMLIVDSFQGRLSAYAGGPDLGSTGLFPSGWDVDCTSVDHLVPQRQPQPKPVWGYSSDMHGRGILIPHWLPASVMGMLAVALGIRLPLQFSLRTLLIATTFIAVVLGLVVWSMR